MPTIVHFLDQRVGQEVVDRNGVWSAGIAGTEVEARPKKANFTHALTVAVYINNGPLWRRNPQLSEQDRPDEFIHKHTPSSLGIVGALDDICEAIIGFD